MYTLKMYIYNRKVYYISRSYIYTNYTEINHEKKRI